jgi:hypothetical protein
MGVRRCIQKFSDWAIKKHSLRSNTKGFGGKTHYTYSQNSDITEASGRELYHLQFSLQAASPETFGYTLVCLTLYYLLVHCTDDLMEELCVTTVGLIGFKVTQLVNRHC